MAPTSFKPNSGKATQPTFEPVIIGFFCNWCAYRAADLAGTARIKYAPNVRPVRLMCSGRVDPAFVVKALSMGADGVLIAGCHPGECHYVEQNIKTMRRVAMLKHTLRALGVEPERVKLTWASAAEGPQLAEAVNELVATIKQLGPLDWPRRWRARQPDATVVAAIAAEHAEAARQYGLAGADAEEVTP